jgi:hypothetical protein
MSERSSDTVQRQGESTGEEDCVVADTKQRARYARRYSPLSTGEFELQRSPSDEYIGIEKSET